MTFWEGFNLVGHVANFLVMAALVVYCRTLLKRSSGLDARINSLEIAHGTPRAHEIYVGKPKRR